MTRGFALAVKSKALLYAASPLHNPDGDNARWLASARAALDIINSGAYVLEKTESANNIASKETVMMVIGTDNSNFELNNFPIRFTESDDLTSTRPIRIQAGIRDSTARFSPTECHSRVP